MIESARLAIKKKFSMGTPLNSGDRLGSEEDLGSNIASEVNSRSSRKSKEKLQAKKSSRSGGSIGN